jgi:hypothetical protein
MSAARHGRATLGMEIEVSISEVVYADVRSLVHGMVLPPLLT